MLQRIKNCFGIDNDTQLDNEVGVDEIYVGGEIVIDTLIKRLKTHKEEALRIKQL